MCSVKILQQILNRYGANVYRKVTWIQEVKQTRDAIGLLRTIGKKYIDVVKEYACFVDME